MARLADAHIEQAKVMRAEGKPIREIVEYLEKTYGISTSEYIVNKAVKAGGGKDVVMKKEKRAYRKKSKSADPDLQDSGKVIKDITALLLEIDNGYKLVFAHLRKELIKSRKEVYDMLVGAGIQIPESDIV